MTSFALEEATPERARPENPDFERHTHVAIDQAYSGCGWLGKHN